MCKIKCLSLHCEACSLRYLSTPSPFLYTSLPSLPLSLSYDSDGCHLLLAVSQSLPMIKKTTWSAHTLPFFLLVCFKSDCYLCGPFGKASCFVIVNLCFLYNTIASNLRQSRTYPNCLIFLLGSLRLPPYFNFSLLNQCLSPVLTGRQQTRVTFHSNLTFTRSALLPLILTVVHPHLLLSWFLCY